MALVGRPVSFVLAPAQGIEPPVQETEPVLAQVAESFGARGGPIAELGPHPHPSFNANSHINKCSLLTLGVRTASADLSMWRLSG